MLTPLTQQELSKLRHPRVEACIAEVMLRFPGDSKTDEARYYEQVHQALAPLARQLERENIAAAALIDAQQKQLADLRGAAGFAEECGVPADGVGL